jgi:hypothetical protein
MHISVYEYIDHAKALIKVHFFLWRNSPTRVQAASLLRFRHHTELDTPRSVGLLWTGDRPVAEA